MKESTSHSRVVLPLHEQGIAIYSRKSRFTGKGESVGNQIELCRQYLRAHEPDAPEPEIFEDDGFSGGDLNRPAFRRMMRAAEAGRFRMLIVYRLDRISRSIGDFTALIERLAQLNVAFVSIREQFDTSTPMGRAMMYIASVFSQLERETIAERIRDNLRELAKTGRWLGGITPTGFASEAVQAVTVDGRTKRACRLRLLPEEAETVKAMYSLFARLGSLTAVVKGLQERGITTKNGNAFTRHAVRDILHNPVYARADADMLAWLRAAGTELSAAQEEFDGRHGVLAYHRTDQSRGRTAVALPPEAWIVAVGQHPGLIPGSQWAAVQERLRRTDCRTPRTEHETPALLAGLLQCRCGRPMYAKYRRAADGERFSYVCRAKSTGGREQCSCPNVPGTAADAAVRAMLCALPEDHAALAAALWGLRRGLPESSPAPPDRIPLVLRDCLDTIRRTQRVLEALTEQLRWDGETLRVTLRRVDCKCNTIAAEQSAVEVENHEPFGAKWSMFCRLKVRSYVLAANVAGTLKVAPLQILKFPVVLPHKFLDAEKFNLRFSDASEITEIADKLRWYRYQKGLRQRDAADYAGIDRSTYIHYEEAGRDFYPKEHMEKLAELFEVPLEDLLDDYNLFLLRGQGAQIKAIRQRLGLTQKAYAAQLGVPLQKFKRWEQGSVQIFKSTWEKYFKQT